MRKRGGKMKDRFAIIILFLVTINMVGEPVDFSDYIKKCYGIEDVNISDIDFELEITNPQRIEDDFQIATAVLYVLSESVLVHFPRKSDEKTNEYIRYKGEPVTKELITAAKGYFMTVAMKHPQKLSRVLALGSIERAFVDDPEIIDWLILKLYDNECDLFLNTLLALTGTAKNSRPEVLNVFLKKALASNDNTKREDSLSAIYLHKYLPDPLLGDLITCMITTKNRRILTQALITVLKEYPVNDLNKYTSTLKLLNKDYPELKLKEFLEWLSNHTPKFNDSPN